MFKRMETTARGFTLIELLIVVAIIAILAGIALPNFLEAQTRAKVVRVKADMRTIVMALEAYKTDNHRYPQSALVKRYERLIPITTPVAYVTSIPKDYFYTTDTGSALETRNGHFVYVAQPIDGESRYLIVSDAPDRTPNYSPSIEYYPGYSGDLFENPSNGYDMIRYDPTNGSVSTGDIYRLSDAHNP